MHGKVAVFHSIIVFDWNDIKHIILKKSKKEVEGDHFVFCKS
jgi:hypothetical protein